MSATVTIPRFLLPQRSQMWRRIRARTSAPGRSSAAHQARYSSTTKPPKSSKQQSKQKPQQQQPPRHTVLEKPTKFNPPSHGARLPKKGYVPRTYGGELSKEQVKVQETKDYPGMPPPKGSRAYWFIHSKGVHLFITLGTLTGLAVFTFVQNFKKTSPYVDMIPPWEEFAWHPLSSVSAVVTALKLTEEHNSALVGARREKQIDDVLKRRRFRKAHGIDENDGVAGWFRGKEEPVKEEEEEVSVSGSTQTPPTPPLEEAEKGPRKKFLGIL